MTVLRVALDVPIPRLFDYSGPATAVVGSRVLVPFGPKRRVGIVCEHAATTEMPVEKLRPITQVLIDTPTVGR